jgi:hypothetical protein
MYVFVRRKVKNLQIGHLYQQHQWYRWESLPPLLLIPVANFPLVLLTPVAKFPTGVVDTSGVP